jgi:hypothetical protein
MEPENSKLNSQVPTAGPLPEPIESNLRITLYFLRSILILPSQLSLGLPSGHFPSDSPTKVLYDCFITMLATCLVHRILTGFLVIMKIGEE